MLSQYNVYNTKCTFYKFPVMNLNTAIRKDDKFSIAFNILHVLKTLYNCLVRLSGKTLILKRNVYLTDNRKLILSHCYGNIG